MSQQLNAAQLANFPKSTAASTLAGTATTEALTPKAIADAVASISLGTTSGTITVNLSSGRNYHFVLNSTGTLVNPSGIVAGQSGRIRIVQDGNGSRTLAYGSYWKFSGGSAPTLSTAANAVDLLVYYVHDTSNIEATIVKDVR